MKDIFIHLVWTMIIIWGYRIAQPHAFAQWENPNTNAAAPQISVMTDTNGVLVVPATFFSANETLIVNEVLPTTDPKYLNLATGGSVVGDVDVSGSFEVGSITSAASIVVTGSVTATTGFVGDGSLLTGINESVFTNNASGIGYTGEVSALNFVGDGSELSGVVAVATNVFFAENPPVGIVYTGDVKAATLQIDSQIEAGSPANTFSAFPLHIQGPNHPFDISNLHLPISQLTGEKYANILLNGEDSQIVMFSQKEGTHSSCIIFGETETNGTFNNSWSIGRVPTGTPGGSAELCIGRYRTSTNYADAWTEAAITITTNHLTIIGGSYVDNFGMQVFGQNKTKGIVRVQSTSHGSDHSPNAAYTGNTGQSLLVEAQEAHIGICSDPSGSWGSRFSFIEQVSTVDATLVDAWIWMRESTGGGGDLVLWKGSDDQPVGEKPMLELKDERQFDFYGSLSIGSTNVIDTTVDGLVLMGRGKNFTNTFVAADHIDPDLGVEDAQALFMGEDSALYLLSEKKGSYGSAISLGEINDATGAYIDQWVIGRESSHLEDSQFYIGRSTTNSLALSVPGQPFLIGTNKQVRIGGGASNQYGVMVDGEMESDSGRIKATSLGDEYSVPVTYTGSLGGSMVVEGQDSTLEIVSTEQGSYGSRLSFVNAVGTSNMALSNHWTFLRETISGGNDLKLYFGLDDNPAGETPIVEFLDDGGINLFSGPLLNVGNATIADITLSGTFTATNSTMSVSNTTAQIANLGTGDLADAGVIRMPNAGVVGWEASPAGTDVTLTVDSSEVLVLAGASGVTLPADAIDDSEVSDTITVGTGGAVKVFTEAHAANHTLTDSECYGSVYYVTAAATLTLPAVAAGMNITVITTAAVAVSVDANASDLINLDGTALDDGDKITSGSTAGEVAVLTYRDATGWFAVTDGWTDTGP